MSSVQAILFQLTSGLVSETAVQTEYLYVPEIVAAIQQYNWSVMPSCVAGWHTLKRYGMYHD
jgi:hypothetical protein